MEPKLRVLAAIALAAAILAIVGSSLAFDPDPKGERDRTLGATTGTTTAELP